jgi:hypothetical protein
MSQVGWVERSETQQFQTVPTSSLNIKSLAEAQYSANYLFLTRKTQD